MSQKDLTVSAYVITKFGMDDWFLYTVEQCSFGKRIMWTKNHKNTIIFTSEEKVKSFKAQVLKNVPVCIHKFIAGGLVYMDF